MTTTLQNPVRPPTNATTLQQGIDRAGSAVHLLWKPGVVEPTIPVVPPEFAGWAQEQDASATGVGLSEQSHHMRDLFIEGPDATRLLSECSVNNYEKFAVGQAKQFVAVNSQGQYVADSVLLRTAEDAYTLTGLPSAMSWVLFHAEQGDYDVSFVDNLDSGSRPAGEPPVLFRFEVQGPRAMDLVSRVFGGPLPETKFFHSTVTTLGGRSVRALRHGMTGQPGYEFIGAWADGPFVKEALLTAGEEFGLMQVGGKAYHTNGVASGWLATEAPAIFTDPRLESYRSWLKLATYEGQAGLHGSFFSEDIEDYYVSPYELGYGRLIHLGHDFPGRDALAETKGETSRTKVTIVLDPEDMREHFGADLGYYLSFGSYRIEAAGRLVGATKYGAHIASAGTVLYLSLVENEYATPGTEVTVVYGEDLGFGRNAAAVRDFPRLRATVQPSPYDAFAREHYRRD